MELLQSGQTRQGERQRIPSCRLAQRKDRKCGPFIGAPRFELGTSSPKRVPARNGLNTRESAWLCGFAPPRSIAPRVTTSASTWSPNQTGRRAARSRTRGAPVSHRDDRPGTDPWSDPRDVDGRAGDPETWPPTSQSTGLGPAGSRSRPPRQTVHHRRPPRDRREHAEHQPAKRHDLSEPAAPVRPSP